MGITIETGWIPRPGDRIVLRPGHEIGSNDKACRVFEDVIYVVKEVLYINQDPLLKIVLDNKREVTFSAAWAQLYIERAPVSEPSDTVYALTPSLFGKMGKLLTHIDEILISSALSPAQLVPVLDAIEEITKDPEVLSFREYLIELHLLPKPGRVLTWHEEIGDDDNSVWSAQSAVCSGPDDHFEWRVHSFLQGNEVRYSIGRSDPELLCVEELDLEYDDFDAACDECEKWEKEFRKEALKPEEE